MSPTRFYKINDSVQNNYVIHHKGISKKLLNMK